ncbi:hypothetical protein Tco_0933469, partial [Tanacetum coccineum]
MILSRIWILFPKDSVDENSLDDNLVDTISDMFTDEHALDYSSPPLWDEYDDELFDLETVNDDTYDDPFDFKEEKIKESKTLIDELDLPGLSDFLPFPEYQIFTKGQKRSQNRQNRAREWKEHEKSKSKSKSKSTKSKSKVKDEADIEEMLNGPT